MILSTILTNQSSKARQGVKSTEEEPRTPQSRGCRICRPLL